MRLSAKAPIAIRGEEITHLDADGYKHLPRATALPDGKVLATSGGKWGASDLSGISVASVFGRTGAVTAQTGDYTAAQVGAEPYAGTPAATSFWRSTAAGVRAWVQLVAADITDLATTLAGYLTKANPTFTGTLTGPTAAFADLTATGSPVFGATSGGSRGVTINSQSGTASGVNLSDGGVTRASLQLYGGSAWRVVARDTGGVEIDTPFYVDLVAGGKITLGGAARTTNFKGAIEIGAVAIADASRNITGTTLKGGNLAGIGNRPLVAGADGTIDDQDAATFRGTIGAGTSNLALGETSSTAHRGDHGVIAYAHSQLTADNPHGTTAAQVGALAAANPNFTGSLLQDGNQRITPSGGGRFTDLALTTLAAGSDLPIVSDEAGVLRNKSASEFRETIGALPTDSPDFSGTLKQGGTTRITSGGEAWFASMQSTNLVGAGDRPVAADLTGTLQPKTPSQARSLIGAAKAPSKVDISASTTLGAIDASAIKVTTTDVILTLSGGVDGQGWDIINPTASTGIAIPSGATLWKSIGSDVGPTTIALGGGRPIRITRIDANTWTMLGSQ